MKTCSIPDAFCWDGPPPSCSWSENSKSKGDGVFWC